MYKGQPINLCTLCPLYVPNFEEVGVAYCFRVVRPFVRPSFLVSKISRSLNKDLDTY